jgi:hypothetical protein
MPTLHSREVDSMIRTPDELLAEALELPEPARARITQSLLASLDRAAREELPLLHPALRGGRQ